MTREISHATEINANPDQLVIDTPRGTNVMGGDEATPRAIVNPRRSTSTARRGTAGYLNDRPTGSLK